MANSGRPPEILLIDDNPGDAKLIELAFRRITPRANISLAPSAELALGLLRGAPAAPRPPPDIVFLDLNLPGMHGLTLLKLMKGDPALKSIPVLVISSSRAQKDIDESYLGYASGFVTKPFDLDGYAAFANEITSYWFKLVQLPCA